MQAFHDDMTLRLELRELLRGLGDLERWSNRVAQPGVALPRDLVGIREVLRKLPEIKGLRDREIQVTSVEDESSSPPISVPGNPGKNNLPES